MSKFPALQKSEFPTLDKRRDEEGEIIWVNERVGWRIRGEEGEEEGGPNSVDTSEELSLRYGPIRKRHPQA